MKVHKTTDLINMSTMENKNGLECETCLRSYSNSNLTIFNWRCRRAWQARFAVCKVCELCAGRRVNR